MSAVYKITAVFLLLPSFLHAVKGGNYLIINDFHYDPTYWTTKESCQKDIKESDLRNHGTYKCDAPWEVVVSAVTAMKKERQNPDFIVVVGDNPHHPLDRSTSILNKEKVLEISRNITILLDTHFPQTPILSVLGNHDYFPRNQLPASGNDQYDEYADMWNKWIPLEHTAVFKKAGYYSYLHEQSTPKLRVIILNTNLYSMANTNASQMKDPGEQYRWLESTLNQSRAASEQVHVAFHIPCGIFVNLDNSRVTMMTDDHNKRLSKLFIEHSDVIVATHTAHIHLDTFTMFYKEGKPVLTQFVNTAVTPWRRPKLKTYFPKTPSFRSVDYTADDNGAYLSEITQYFLSLPDDSATEATWKKRYDMTTTYSISDLKPQSMHKVLKNFKAKDSETFNTFFKYYSAAPSKGTFSSCDCPCKKTHLCGIEFWDYDDNKNCQDKEVKKCESAGNKMAITPVVGIISCLLLVLFG